MIAVVVKFVVKSQYIDDFRAAIKIHASNTLTNEPGCKQFDVCRDPQNDQIIFLYEVYESPEALAVHQKAPYLAKFGQIAGEMIENRELVNYEIINR
ncbi:putative quinol monooxygenase [Lacunimicrobium album]